MTQPQPQSWAKRVQAAGCALMTLGCLCPIIGLMLLMLLAALGV